MKRREILSFPVKKKKLGTVAERSKGKPSLTPLSITQYAIERAVRRIEALEKQCDGLAKLDKAREIEINYLRLQMKRFEERIEGMDSE
jgi:hypothetical protein